MRAVSAFLHSVLYAVPVQALFQVSYVDDRLKLMYDYVKIDIDRSALAWPRVQTGRNGTYTDVIMHICL